VQAVELSSLQQAPALLLQDRGVLTSQLAEVAAQFSFAGVDHAWLASAETSR
jgi:hypothetical protein